MNFLLKNGISHCYISLPEDSEGTQLLVSMPWPYYDHIHIDRSPKKDRRTRLFVCFFWDSCWRLVGRRVCALKNGFSESFIYSLGCWLRVVASSMGELQPSLGTPSCSFSRKNLTDPNVYRLKVEPGTKKVPLQFVYPDFLYQFDMSWHFQLCVKTMCGLFISSFPNSLPIDLTPSIRQTYETNTRWWNFKYVFNFHPEAWGRWWFPFVTCVYFSDGGVETWNHQPETSFFRFSTYANGQFLQRCLGLRKDGIEIYGCSFGIDFTLPVGVCVGMIFFCFKKISQQKMRLMIDTACAI